MLGLAKADGGDLEILGHPMRRMLALPDGVAGFVDGPGLYPSLTARQNLDALTRLRGDGADGIDDALAQVGLTDVADDRIRGFSLGMRQRLGLAAALLTRPRLLVLDEPANGLDPTGTRHVHRVLTRLAAHGTAVVLSSHRMDDLAALCSEVTILARGSRGLLRPARRARRRHRRARLPAPHHRSRHAPGESRRNAGAATCSRTTIVLQRHDAERSWSRGAAALDDLVARLVGAGVSVRELAPVVAPLEAAFLALTAAQNGERGRGPVTTAAAVTTRPGPTRRRHPFGGATASSWSSCWPSGASVGLLLACWLGPAIFVGGREPAELAAVRHRLRPLDGPDRLGRSAGGPGVRLQLGCCRC